MGRSEVVEQARWVVLVQRRHRDVDDAPRAVEGFLERVRTNVAVQPLLKRVVRGVFVAVVAESYDRSGSG